MLRRTFWLRLLAGVGVLALTLVVSFAAFMSLVPRWGATEAELALALPGDELIPNPLVQWTNAINIDAPPAAVWPWIAQLGDTRGGFYSYTFIEDRVGAITGSADYQVDYENANRIVPEWQQPAPGDQIIQDVLKVRAVQPGQYLLADALHPEDMGWVWVWWLEPRSGGTQSRLIVRCLIQIPGQNDNPVMGGVLNVGGFVMQQRMMHGLRLRAEGGTEPAYIELIEIALWLLTLAVGVIAAVLYLVQRDWRWPLVVAVAAVLALVALTFIQPDIWVRLLVNAALAAALWQVRRSAQHPRQTLSFGRLGQAGRPT